VVKTAGFAAFYRLFSMAFEPAIEVWSVPIAMVAALTMTLANTTALFQTDFKRMMAYSSISHAGIPVAGRAGDRYCEGADRAMMFYLLSYSIATICAFGAYMVVAEQERRWLFCGIVKRANTIHSLRQCWRYPYFLLRHSTFGWLLR
ncbi:MAG: hypothetical protein IPH31_21945, partial [Lewinellaceae bacterium]|nr:hypothetical protein [Lewinellaceae bacterium]